MLAYSAIIITQGSAGQNTQAAAQASHTPSGWGHRMQLACFATHTGVLAQASRTPNFIMTKKTHTPPQSVIRNWPLPPPPPPAPPRAPAAPQLNLRVPVYICFIFECVCKLMRLILKQLPAPLHAPAAPQSKLCAPVYRHVHACCKRV